MVIFFGCSERNCGELEFDKQNKITYLKGEPFSGKCESFYFTGQLKSKEAYLKGKDHGQWTYFYENNNTQFSGTFNLGKREGEWKYYYENGTLWKQNFYKGGKQFGVWKEFNKNGKIIDSILIKN